MASSHYSLRDRVVLITGGSRGLGFILAREFGREGARVAICARDFDELAHAAHRLREEGIDVLTHACDLSHVFAARGLVESVISHFGRLDIVVNNAGIIQVGPVEAMSFEDFQNIMEINFGATLRVSFAAIPELRKTRGARIVNITSIGGAIAIPHVLPYTASKFAQLGFSLGLRSELLKDGIRVVSILPGLMRTGSFLQALFKGQRSKEFRIFSLTSSLPLVTLDAERAGRKIIRATKQGQALVTLGWPFRIARLLYGLAPGIGTNFMGWINRMLPAASEERQGTGAIPGHAVHPPRLWVERRALRLGARAATRYNEHRRRG